MDRLRTYISRLTVIILLVAIVAVAIGWLIGYNSAKQQNIPLPVEIREDSSDYKYINPILYIRTSKDLFVSEYAALDQSVEDAISSAKRGSASDVAFYFRDLNSGHWTGVNENEQFKPSSMLKVLTLMAAYKLFDDGSLSPSQRFYYKPADENLQYYRPQDGLEAGYYTVDDLLKAMVVYSDNAAKDALFSDRGIQNDFAHFYTVFRLPVASTTNADFMSARSYSVIFRTLYNSTALSESASDKVLQLLTYTKFDKGLVSGVPKGTVVAHKFGESTELLPDGTKANSELHDCGIIYYPGHPYLICVMTRGNDFPDLEKVISGISKIVYDYVDGSYASE